MREPFAFIILIPNNSVRPIGFSVYCLRVDLLAYLRAANVRLRRSLPKRRKRALPSRSYRDADNTTARRSNGNLPLQSEKNAWNSKSIRGNDFARNSTFSRIVRVKNASQSYVRTSGCILFAASVLVVVYRRYRASGVNRCDKYIARKRQRARSHMNAAFIICPYSNGATAGCTKRFERAPFYCR